MITIKEIAQLAGVSRGTVDRVLNHRGSVNPETTERVLRIVRELDYTPNAAAKRLSILKKQLRFSCILFDPIKNPFFLDLIAGIKSKQVAFADYGIHIQTFYTDIDDPESQIKAIDSAVSTKCDGLVITASNHPMIVDRLKSLTQSGLPIVTANNDIPECGRLAYVGSDDYKCGQTAGGIMRLITDMEANVGIVESSQWALSDQKRIEGFQNRVLSNDSRIKVVDIISNHNDEIVSYLKTKELIEIHPEINALYLCSVGIKGACRAVQEAGKKGKIKIICHDTTPSICSLIEDRTIAATIEQQPFIQGTKPLDILLDYISMGIRPKQDVFHTEIELKILENLH